MQRIKLFVSVTLFITVIAPFISCKQKSSLVNDYSSWNAYAGSKDGIRYSSNDEVNKKNVHQLKIAWTYSSRDADTGNRSQNQCNPIVVGNVLYGVSPAMKLFALDAASGKQLWLFDPATVETDKKDPMAFYKVSRGVLYWESENGEEKRIFHGVGNRIYAVDASSGKLQSDFGTNGFIDVSDGLDREKNFNSYIAVTTPGIIYKNLLITGMRVAESQDAAPGHIRAFNVRTGKREWIFHTIPQPGEKGYETWEDKDAWKKFGGANSWAGMSLDEKTGILYVPTGSVGGDFYGGDRKGENLYSNSLIALDAATGKYVWHYQTVHHDLWDRDLAANPNLVTVRKDGQSIDAVAQITKHGYVFLFDRKNGNPVFPIKEMPVPTNALPGETVWPTQPIPALPEPFARQRFEPEDVTDIDAATNKEMLERYNKIKNRVMFAPPSKEGGWIFPGFDGGGEWGGAAVDPGSGILYVNSSEMPWSQVMIELPADKNISSIPGADAYEKNCISCHTPSLKGNGTSIPSLLNIDSKYTPQQIADIVRNGRNMMPSFKHLSDADRKALNEFMLKPDAYLKIKASQPSKEPASEPGASKNGKPVFAMKGYDRFLDRNGYPGIKPPWGTLNAVDLNTGKLLWKVPLGEYAELTRRGIAPTGTENYGGPVVTKGGLIFIAATKDAKIRAFDKDTGKILWSADLPVPGYATPSVYAVKGKQYIVIACGGGKIGSKSGDSYVAFALE